MRELFHQLGKFVSVGLVATALHVMVALSLNGAFAMAPLRANVIAFFVATIWSYLGNWIWTFNAATHFQYSAPRFLALSAGCFAINQAIVYGVVVLAQLPLWLAMIPVVAVVPVLSFWMSRTRIFKPALST